MEGRSLWGAGFLALVSSIFLLAGGVSTASAAESTTCAVHSLPSFVDQGEFAEASTVADIVEVECNPEVYAAGAKVKVSANQLYSRCKGKLSWITPIDKVTTGPTVTLSLDNDGNATVAAIAGGGCMAGESLISAHLSEAPYETFTTVFKVLPPQDTAPGVTALPSTQVEDDVNSSIATVFQVEFPSVYAERYVHISAEELFSRCQKAPHLVYIGENGKIITNTEGAISKVKLDNNGNAFVLVLGDSSCASGTTLIEADLESSPFTTYTNTFTVQSPRPTAF